MKKVFFLICVVCCMISSICFAKVNPTDFSISGITIGQKAKYVENLYGKPYFIKNITDTMDVWSYRKDNLIFDVRVQNEKGKENTVEGVTCFGNTGLATEGGVSYGSTAEQIKSAYGTPDYEGMTDGYDSPFKGHQGLDYSCMDNTYLYIMHFGLENNHVIGFYITRHPKDEN